MENSRNRWLILAVICIPVFVGSLDLTVVSAFLPELLVDLGISPLTGLDDAAWIVTGYLLAYTISLTFMGRVSDLIGRRWVYAISLLIFIAGSIFVATAHQLPTDLLEDLRRRAGERPLRADVNLQAIVIGRVIQAFGAGALVPVSMALVGDLFPVKRRAQALGIIGAVDTLGWVLGHLYGGIFLQIPGFEWQHLFWMNVPLTLFALIVTLWVLRGATMQRVKGRFDIIGAALIAGALTCLNIGLGANIDISGSTSSFDQLTNVPPYATSLLVIGAALFLLFILVESRVRDPLINLKMFAKRNISAGSLTNFFIGYCLFIGLVSVPILVNVRQDSFETLTEAALTVGLMLSALTVPMAIATVPGGWLSTRLGYSRVIIGGLLVSAFGFLLIWQTWHIDISDLSVIVQMAIVGVGIGLTFSPISASVINAASDEERGVASAMVLILRLIGMTISVSSLTTYALNRINFIASNEDFAGNSGDIMNAAFDTYPEITAKVLSEFGLIGAGLCIIAILPALFIKDDEGVERYIVA